MNPSLPSDEPASFTSHEEVQAYLLRRLALDDQLHDYRTRIESRVKRLARIASPSAGQSAELEEARAFEKDWHDVHQFLTVAHDNNGDLFPYLFLIHDNPAAFEKIGALGTIAMATGLRPLFEEYDRLEGAEEKEAFRQSIADRISAAETLADGSEELGGLMLSFAQSHEESFDPPEEKKQGGSPSVTFADFIAGMIHSGRGESGEETLQQQLWRTYADSIGLKIPPQSSQSEGE